MGAYIAIVAIVAWALVSMMSIRAKGGAGTAEVEEALARMAEALDAAEAERKRLTERVQNLEAIVTTETYELARHDPEQAAARLKLPEEEEETPEAQAARLARRMRT